MYNLYIIHVVHSVPAWYVHVYTYSVYFDNTPTNIHTIKDCASSHMLKLKFKLHHSPLCMHAEVTMKKATCAVFFACKFPVHVYSSLSALYWLCMYY